MEFPIFTEMFTAVDGALAAIIAKYAAIIALVRPALIAGVTIYIILLGGAILRGAVQFPFREFVYRGLKLAALCYAVSTMYGAHVGMLTMEGLPRDFANALGGANVDGLGGYFDTLLQGAFRAIAKITEIVDRHTAEAGTNLVGIPNNFIEILTAALLNLTILVIALLSTALGFTICAFALFALALLAVVGPLFLAALLFDSTRGYFFAWLGSAISYIMLVAFALLVTLFVSQTTDTFINAITTNDHIMVAALKAIAFYILGFFFFLQIPSLASGLGGGGPALATQFAHAVTGNIAPMAGRAMSNAPRDLARAAFSSRGSAGGGGGSAPRSGGTLTRT
jgi:type IV secretion system protein VirB6